MPVPGSPSSLALLAGIEDELRLECGHADLRVDWSMTESMRARLGSMVNAAVLRVQGDGCSDRVVVQVSGADGRSTNRYLVSGDVEIWGHGLRAARTLRPGTLLAFDDVTEGEDWFPPSACRESIESVEGSYLLRGIAAGKVLGRDDLSSPPLVRRGETVRVVYRGPGLELRTLGTVRKDGWLGDRLEVRADGAQHDCTGVVSGPDVIEVESNQGRQR
ncbi:MAG: flagellar basal body P-ring formation chaperone FlgA [Candidatus Eisenbacteria bacterium]